MTIQITKPEIETLINQRLQTGEFQDAEDMVSHALRHLPPRAAPPQLPVGASEPKSLVELFAPLRGLNIDFEADRMKDTGRDIEL